MQSKPVEFVGGPADGRRVLVPIDQYEIIVYVFPGNDEPFILDKQPDAEKHIYDDAGQYRGTLK